MELGNWLIVIPARLASTRLANKPLQMLGGKPLIQRVFENLLPLKACGAELVVAIDSKEVQKTCESHNIPWMLTDVKHASGTDRCHEVAQHFKRSYIMNVQGDEPFVNLDDLKSLAKKFEESSLPMGTLIYKNLNSDAFKDPNIVKVAPSFDNKAIYFSRAPIPFNRDAALQGKPVSSFWQHLGIYVFKREALAQFCNLPKSWLEETERLEQLRAIEAGWDIFVSTANHASIGIDTPEDLAHAESRYFAAQGSKGY